MALKDRSTRGGPLEPIIIGGIDTGVQMPVLPVDGSNPFPTSPQSNFNYDIALGRIAGWSDEFIIGLNRNVGNVLEDVWGAGADIVFPTAGEQWEIVSDNANDTIAGGSGAQLAVLVYLDTNYDVQTEVIAMTGLVAAPTVATNIFRPRVLLIILSGSTGSNEGAIISRVVGGGATRNYIHPNFGFSFDGHFTVQRGVTALMTFCEVNAGRGDGIEFRLKTSFGASFTNMAVIQYNNVFENVINTIPPVPLAIAERSDMVMGALNTAGGATADCFAVCQLVTVEI